MNYSVQTKAYCVKLFLSLISLYSSIVTAILDNCLQEMDKCDDNDCPALNQTNIRERLDKYKSWCESTNNQ